MSQFPFERKDKAKRGNKFQFGKSGLFHKQKQGVPGPEYRADAPVLGSISYL